MISKIEDIVRKSLNVEYEKQLKNIESQYQRSTEQLGFVYKETKDLIEELGISDATLLDFFMKTDGNVRMRKFDSGDNRRLELRTDYGEEMFNNNPIRLERDTKYKIILIAVKEED